jgi:hypothetical protein
MNVAAGFMRLSATSTKSLPSDKIFLSRQLRAEHLTNRQVKRANKIVDQGRPLAGGSVSLWAWVL